VYEKRKKPGLKGTKTSEETCRSLLKTIKKSTLEVSCTTFSGPVATLNCNLKNCTSCPVIAEIFGTFVYNIMTSVPWGNLQGAMIYNIDASYNIYSSFSGPLFADAIGYTLNDYSLSSTSTHLEEDLCGIDKIKSITFNATVDVGTGFPLGTIEFN